MDKNMNIDFT